MLRTVKFLLWTGCCVGLGLYLSTFQVGGRSTVDLLRQAWKQHGATASASVSSSVKGKLGEVFGEARELVPAPRPKEHHSSEDRDAVNKLIATQGEKG